MATSQKKYYDLLSFLSTQLAFSFATAPFLILSLNESITVWARVYFYVIIGTLSSMAFFASPGKAYLKSRLEERQAHAGVKLARTTSQDSIAGQEPVLGLSADPEKDLDEAMETIRAEVSARQRKMK